MDLTQKQGRLHYLTEVTTQNDITQLSSALGGLLPSLSNNFYFSQMQQICPHLPSFIH